MGKDLDLKKLKEGYCSGKSSYILAKEFNVTPKTIISKLVKSGVKIRSVSDSLKMSYRNGFRKHTLMSKECRRFLSRKRMGENNPNWNPNRKDRNFQIMKKMVLENKINKCKYCTSNKNICIHHKDFNHDNDNSKNLIPVCKRCHSIIHDVSKNFSHTL